MEPRRGRPVRRTAQVQVSLGQGTDRRGVHRPLRCDLCPDRPLGGTWGGRPSRIGRSHRSSRRPPLRPTSRAIGPVTRYGGVSPLPLIARESPRSRPCDTVAGGPAQRCGGRIDGGAVWNDGPTRRLGLRSRPRQTFPDTPGSRTTSDVADDHTSTPGTRMSVLATTTTLRAIFEHMFDVEALPRGSGQPLAGGCPV